MNPTDIDHAAATVELPPAEEVAAILDAITDPVVKYRVDDLRITFCNTAWSNMFDVDLDHAVGRPLNEFCSDDGLVGLRRQLAVLGPDHPVATDAEARSALHRPDIWLQWVDRYLPNCRGDEVLSIARDVSDRVVAERRLAKSEEAFRTLADHSCDIVWRMVTAPVPRFDYVSPSVEHITGYPPDFFVNDFEKLSNIIDETGRRAVANTLRDNYRLDTFDMRIRRPDGSIVICETRATRIGDVVQGISRDVTEVRELRDRLTQLASHDPLTGLPNRRRLAELLDTELASIRERGGHLAVGFIDLDGLKDVNDCHGHPAGDALLRGVADRLSRACGANDIVARYGGDEFIVVSTAVSVETPPLADRVQALLEQPLVVSPGVEVVPSASVGVATTEEVGGDAAALIGQADRAMYKVKRARRHIRLQRVGVV